MVIIAEHLTTKRRDKENYVAYGGAAEMIQSTAMEVLIEGPAHTGKTRSVLEKCYLYLTEFSGLRMLWVRKTRKALTESVLTTWEDEVLPEGHHCIHGTASKEHRQTYKFSNGSVVVLAGMDTQNAIMSAQYDVIVFFEATQGTHEDWLHLITRNRNKSILLGWDPGAKRNVFFHQMIADCNPGTEHHWLNQRADKGHMHRILSRHVDNPMHDEDDQKRLDSLTGTTRKRLRDGIWCSEFGQVYDCWDPATMMCNREDLLIDRGNPYGGYRFDAVFGSIDFGMRDPQVFQVWGVIGDVMYLVAEIYKRRDTERGVGSQRWWADKIARLIDVWKIKAIVADGGGLGISLIDDLNDRIGSRGGNYQSAIVRPARKGKGSVMRGLKMVEARMEQGGIKICHDALEEGRCEISADMYKPCATFQELPAYVWKKAADGAVLKDAPDDACEDHGMDGMRYMEDFLWGRNFTEPEDKTCAPGTIGDLTGHNDWLKKLGRKRRA